MSTNGAADFDFLHGSWLVHNRKLRDNSDPTCTEWVEFDARSEVTPILFGGGNFDRMIVDDPPDGPAFEGDTLRIFEPATQTWGIWWSSTRQPGKLDVPVRGRFDGARGVFECDDIVGGLPVRTRFEWLAGPGPRWEQSYSYDGGASWAVNWIMTLVAADRANATARA
jgi:hypothetical protein